MYLLARLGKLDVLAKKPPSAMQRARAAWNARAASRTVTPSTQMTNLEFAGPAGPLPARLYEPAGIGPEPGLLVFVHGGGWHIYDVDCYDGLADLLAVEAGVKVLSVDYRLAPEHPFPALFDDVLAGFRYAVDNAGALGVDPHRIGIGGDSAGGNLASAVALHTAGDDRYRAAFVALIYPAVDSHLDRYPSSRMFGVPLDYGCVERAFAFYGPRPEDHADPRFCVMAAADVAAMPPTYIATGGMDVLRDQGEAFGRRLADAGVDAEVRRFDCMPHGFGSMLIDGDARAAMTEIAVAIRARIGDAAS
jgi:acetyl esterase